MANIHLHPPEPLNFQQLDDKSHWKHWFDQFKIASGLENEPEEKQVSTLIYCMGEQAEVILVSTNIMEEEKKVYVTLCQKFDFSKFDEISFLKEPSSIEECQVKGEPWKIVNMGI